jgi:hypothetical protein
MIDLDKIVYKRESLDGVTDKWTAHLVIEREVFVSKKIPLNAEEAKSMAMRRLRVQIWCEIYQDTSLKLCDMHRDFCRDLPPDLYWKVSLPIEKLLAELQDNGKGRKEQESE